MTVVLDASVCLKWLFEEADSDKADALYQDAINSPLALLAPVLLPSEVTNAVRQRMRRSGLSLPDAQALLRQFLTLDIALIADLSVFAAALELAEQLGLPSAYDAQYVALAKLRSGTLWTADQRLINTLGGRLAFVHWLGDYAGNPTP